MVHRSILTFFNYWICVWKQHLFKIKASQLYSAHDINAFSLMSELAHEFRTAAWGLMSLRVTASSEECHTKCRNFQIHMGNSLNLLTVEAPFPAGRMKHVLTDTKVILLFTVIIFGQFRHLHWFLGSRPQKCNISAEWKIVLICIFVHRSK